MARHHHKLRIVLILAICCCHFSTQQGLENLFSNMLKGEGQQETPVTATPPPKSDSKIDYWNPLTWFSTTPKKEEEFYPDADLSTPEIAIRHGYAAETHTVKTDDGYLLTMHRMPCGRFGCSSKGRGSGQPVFLQHGLLSSSADWLTSGPEKALAMILADMGYDVWMGNARGNTYSRKHINLSNEDAKFWEFSWHEMALYDIPAEIDYIHAIKGYESNELTPTNSTNLLYIGHSMGTTMAFALLSMRPEYNQKIRAIFAMAPVAFMSKIKSPIRLLAPFSKDIEMPLRYLSVLRFRIPRWFDNFADLFFKRTLSRVSTIVKFFGANEFLPQSKILRMLAKYGCELTDAERFICENTIFVLCGFDRAQYNATLMPIIFGHTPAGTSTKTLVHYAQEIHTGGDFQYFDYGEKENMKRYGQNIPPLYDLTNVDTPIALFYATNDWLAGPQDVALLFDRLYKTSVGMFRVPFEHFNHLDFMWGIDAPKLVYKPIIELMQRYR